MPSLLAIVFALLDPRLTVEQSTRAASLFELTIQLPDVQAMKALGAVDGAVRAETPSLPAELLIAVAWGESRFETRTLTGRCCGPMQTMARSSGDCRRWSDPVEGFKAGVAELDAWAHDRRVAGNVRRMLLAQACGNAAFDGTCSKTAWPGWVLRRANRLGYRSVSPRS